jgi:hypothetical protein
MSRGYDILPRSASAGGGWHLAMTEEGKERGTMVFPVAEPHAHHALSWWAVLTDDERTYWLSRSGAPDLYAAHRDYLLHDAFVAAASMAQRWLQNLCPAATGVPPR